MNKRIFISLLFVISLLFTGCSVSKEELKETDTKLELENVQLKEKIASYKEMDNLLNFYNNITIDTINSVVLVESRNSVYGTSYSNGVVVASDGYYYYIISDYNVIKKPGTTSYRVLDASASVYNAEIATTYDAATGLVLLRVNISRHTTINMARAELGVKSDLVGYVSSHEQLNKVNIVSNIKTSTITYDDTSYVTYKIDNADPGSVLINETNQVSGFYLSKIDCFIDHTLFKYIIAKIYSLYL